MSTIELENDQDQCDDLEKDEDSDLLESDLLESDLLLESDADCLEPPSKIPRLEDNELMSINEGSASDGQCNLHEFEIIDELDNDDILENEESDEYLDDNELYDLLDQGMDGKLLHSDPDNARESLEEKEKIVLKEKGQNPFDILPEGWVVVTHNSGMPVYLHKETRVCTMSRPYFLGPGSVRRHDIPISAIPCLQYRRALAKEVSTSNTTVSTDEAEVKVDETESNVNNDEKGDNSVEDMTGNNFDEGEKSVQEITEINFNNDKMGENTDQNLTGNSIKIEEKEEIQDSTGNNLSDEKGENTVIVLAGNNLNNDKNGENSSRDLTGSSIKNDEKEETSVEELEHISVDPDSEIVSKTIGDSEVAMDTGTVDDIEKTVVTDLKSCQILPGSKVRIETLSERKQDTSLDPLEVREYCEKLFEFKSITVKKWRTWKDRRIHMKKQFRPELPSNTKLLITCPVPPTSKTGLMKSSKLKEFVLNPSGKSYICILHEYIQHTMRVQPRYTYKELENSMTPFSATVMIEDIEYGTGYASSKKAAKLQAAKATLEVLIPDMNKVTQDPSTDIEDLSFFDEVKIEDPRVYELGNKAGQPSPYQILDECLKRNYGLGDTKCTMNMKLLKHQKSEFTLTVGKHTASVIAKNKRDGKQRAAQAILQLLHPHVSCWGSLLRLYGKSSYKGLNEKKEELNINQLQNQDKAVKPCLNILEKLKKEMMKLHAEKGSIKSKGKLHIEASNLPKKVPNLDL